MWNRMLIAGALSVILMSTVLARGGHANESAWRDNWAIRKNFALSIDTEGYAWPTAIAFVPNPGDGPKDPLYFVTELRGAIKVVTNDRSVYTFADGFFDHTPAGEWPHMSSQAGMCGLALEPSRGYVYVTYAYHTPDGSLRNAIDRFETTPGTFGLKPTNHTTYRKLFESWAIVNINHQIGPIIVHDDRLYVGVGDAGAPANSQSIDSPLGKVLRFTLDVEAAPDNPFYNGDMPDAPRSFVYAYGLRNPFGLTAAGDEIWASDNGPNTDRFVRLRPGHDHHYDGTDWSMAVDADVVFPAAVAPMHVCYVDRDNTILPPEYRSSFYLALTGSTLSPGASDVGAKSIVQIGHDPAHQHVTGPARPMIKFIGENHQMPVAAAMGPDGLYIVDLHPIRHGKAAVLKLTPSAGATHPHLLDAPPPRTLFTERGCIGCHSFNPSSVRVGPSLDQASLLPRVRERIFSDAYLQWLDELDRSSNPVLVATRDARDEVRQARGEDRLRAWFKHRILHPRFDTPDSAMPVLGLPEHEAEAMAAYLANGDRAPSAAKAAKQWIAQWIPYPIRVIHLAEAFVAGAVAMLLAGGAVWLILRWRRGRSGAKPQAEPAAAVAEPIMAPATVADVSAAESATSENAPPPRRSEPTRQTQPVG